MKKILITGAGGFVGSHLIKYLQDNTDYTIYATAYSNNSHATNLLPGSHLFVGDLTDYSYTEKVIMDSQPDIIFHLAALSVVHNSVKKAQKILTSNLILQHNLLEAVKSHSSSTRIVAICSANEYGKVDASDVPIDELTPLKPLNPYAVSKITQEFLSLQYHLAYGMDIVILRPFNHIGERQSDNFAISAFAKQIVSIEKGLQDKLKVGSLDAIRDFTDVKDMVKAYVLAATKCEPGEIYNIGSGSGVSIQDALSMLIKLSTSKIEIEQDESRMRSSDVPLLIADSSKFTKLTGWKPEILLEKTLERVLNYWREELK